MRLHSKYLIDLNRLDRNLDQLKNHFRNKLNFIFMVKANAYGFGAVEIVNRILKDHPAASFGVATLLEGTELLANFSKNFKVYVFSDLCFSQQTVPLYEDKRLLPVVSNLDDLDFFLGNPVFNSRPLVLKFDTGMHRLGIVSSDIDQVIIKLKRAKRFVIHHLMTHFATSYIDKNNNPLLDQQAEAHQQFKILLKSSGISIEEDSIANSGALEQDFHLNCSHARPGLMIYGPCSLMPAIRKNSWFKGEVLSQLEVSILQKKEIKKGEPVGYGATPAPYGGDLLLLALGYADGLPLSISNRPLMIEGIPVRVMGRVSMDVTAVLISKKYSDQVKKLKHLILWDANPDSLYELSEIAKTIPYDLFTRVSSRVPRIYRLE